VKELRLYINRGIFDSVSQGRHKQIKNLINAFESNGLDVILEENSPSARKAAPQLQALCLFQGASPIAANCLHFSRAHVSPFWRIEKSWQPARFAISGKRFEPADVDDEGAKWFFRYWRKRLVEEQAGSRVPGGYVLVLLQRNLDTVHPGQEISSFDMVHEVLKQDAFRPVIIRFEASAKPTPRDLALAEELDLEPRVTFSTAPVDFDFAGSDYVVAHGSDAAFRAILHKKPSILYEKADFHHINQSVPDLGADLAFRNVLSYRRPWHLYFTWFLRDNAINLGRADNSGQIMDHVRSLGWEV